MSLKIRGQGSNGKRCVEEESGNNLIYDLLYVLSNES